MNSDFYTTSAFEREEQSLICTLHYNAEHPIFEGHFPGNPIVPGVCTMAIVKELLRKAIGQSLLLQEAKVTKFLGLINPSMEPQLSISWKEEGDQITATVSLKAGDISLFRMSGMYIPTNPFNLENPGH